jgi:type 1 glutamine amidotransferase
MKTAGALICFLVASLAFAAPPRPRKIVLIAGPKSHGPGAHEYLKSVKLLKALLDRSPNGGPVTTEIYFNSWPEHPETLDTADTVVIISEGQPGDTNPPVPYVIPERMKVLEKQMQRGCGIVTIHYTTFITYAYVDEILEWQGGYYEWKGPPERRSAIKTLETDVKLGVPQHPISNGLRDFKLKDEYYYKLRFRPNDPKLKPILQVPALSDDPEQQIVAWAVERQGGGRGFSTTTGHFFENWKNDSYRKLMLNAVLWTSGTDVPPGGVESTYVDEQAVDQALMVSPIPALVVTSDPKRSACIVSALTSETRRFQVKIADSLERENLNRNKLILLTESNPRDKAHLTRYMKHGGGVALVHIPPGTDNEPSGVYRIRVAADHPITHNVAAFETTDRLSTGGPDASDSRVLATAQSERRRQGTAGSIRVRTLKGTYFPNHVGWERRWLAEPGPCNESATAAYGRRKTNNRRGHFEFTETPNCFRHDCGVPIRAGTAVSLRRTQTTGSRSSGELLRTCTTSRSSRRGAGPGALCH